MTDIASGDGAADGLGDTFGEVTSTASGTGLAAGGSGGTVGRQRARGRIDPGVVSLGARRIAASLATRAVRVET
jgi:hypothetical protein